MPAQNRLQSTVDKRRFARSRHTGHYGKCAERQGEVYIFEVVACGAVYRNVFSIAFAALGRRDNLLCTIEITRSDSICLQHIGRRALKNYISALAACSRTYIDDVIGIEHYIFVVLHHYYSVGSVAQAFERRDKSVVVALMQTD